MLSIFSLWLNPVYPKKSLKVYFQISPKWHGLSQTSGSSYTHSKDVLMHVDLLKKKVLLHLPTLLQISNFLIQKRCLKESSLFNFPMAWTYQQIITQSCECLPHMESSLSLLSLPCRKLLHNATTISI